MKFESFEIYRIQELSELPDLEATPLPRLENQPCDAPENIEDLMKIEISEGFVSFKGGMKLPPISTEVVDSTKPLLRFLNKLELGVVGENDKLLGITEGYVIANWETDEIFGGKVTDRGVIFQPKMFPDKIKVYRDCETGLFYVQEPSGYLAKMDKARRWERSGFSYVYKNYFGHEVAVKWQKN